MASITKIQIDNYSIIKVLDDNYTSTTEEFEIPSWASLQDAGVFIFAENVTSQVSVISSKISIVFSREMLSSFGYGRWPFEIRAVFANGHVCTLIRGDLTVTPFA